MKSLIHKILLESEGSQMIDSLYSYLNMSNDEKFIDAAYNSNYYIDEFLENNHPELSEQLKDFETYEKIDELDNKGKKDVIKSYGEFIVNDKYYSGEIDSTEQPTWMCLDSVTLFKDEWLIHFTDDAWGIESNGFTHGTDNISSLCLTTHFSQDSKSRGGYNFAYTLDDTPRTSSNYGDEIVLFRVPSCVRARHNWDEEYQTIFWGSDATNIITLNSDLLWEDEDDYDNYVEFDTIREMANYYIDNKLYQTN